MKRKIELNHLILYNCYLRYAIFSVLKLTLKPGLWRFIMFPKQCKLFLCFEFSLICSLKICVSQLYYICTYFKRKILIKFYTTFMHVHTIKYIFKYFIKLKMSLIDMLYIFHLK